MSSYASPKAVTTHRRDRFLFSAAAVLAGLFGQAALAQDAIELDPITLSGGETGEGEARGDGTGPGEANEQKGFVAKRSAGATKTNTPLVETPQSITVVTDEQIARQEVRTIRAAARYTAGVTPEITGGADTRFGGFNIRGFDATANSTFLDGLRLPSSSVINFLGLDPYGAERIEILKGPSSVLYGQNGPGGLVNYVSKKPTGAPLREIEVSGGSFGLLEGRFDLSGPVSENSPFGYRLTGVARNSENQVDFVDDDRLFIAPAIDWKPDADTSLTVQGNYQRDRAGWGLQFFPASGTVFGNDGRRIPNSRFLGEPDFDSYDTDLGSLGYQFDHRIDEVFTVRQNARYSFLRHDEASIYGGGYADEAAGLLNRNGGTGNTDLDTVSIDNQIQAEFGTGPLAHTLLGGLDYRRTGYTDRIDLYGADPIDVFAPVYGSPVTSFGTYYDNDISQDQTGVYLQDQIRIDKLSVILSGRYDWATTELERPESLYLPAVDARKNADAFTGRIGLIYNFDNGIAPYVTYSESFLPPLDVSTTGALFEPETGRLYEAGVKYQPPSQDATVTASVFDIVRDDAIRFGFDPVANRSLVEQTGQIESRGFELEGVASITDELNLRLAYTYLDVEITKDLDGGFEGKTPTTIPEHTIAAWADYTIHDDSLFDGLGAGLGVRYVGSTFGDDANTFKVPDATVFDAVVSYEKDNYALSVNASNLFDKEYVASCGNRDFYCFYAEGRRITGKATIRW